MTEEKPNANDLIWPMRYDLHTHSRVSDGIYAPRDLVAYAKKRHVDVLALTDHDTFLGLDEAVAAGKEYGVHIVAGIELSTLWHSNQVHIVGLCIDWKNKELADFVELQTQKRTERAIAIGQKLEKCGFKDAYAKTCEMFGNSGVITRGNYAAWLFSVGAGLTIDKCFSQYLAHGCIAYVKPNWDGIDVAISAIKAAGGFAVLAHPHCYDMNNKWLRKLIVNFKELGGEAMEVCGGMISPAQRDFLARLATEYNLLASCGSDFHREKTYLDLGSNMIMAESVTPIWRDSRFKLEV